MIALLIILLSFMSAIADALLSNKPPFCVNVKCIVKPERRDEFIAVIQNHQRLTLQEEPSALQYIVGEDIEELSTFYLHEQFGSREAFDFHKHSPHNAKWQKFKQSNPFSAPPTTDFFEGKHSPIKLPPPIDTVYCLNVQLSVNPEYRNSFLQVIENNSRGSNQDESLCLQYVWGEDIEAMNIFHFHEEFTGKEGGKEGFDEHVVSPHFLEWEKFAAEQNAFSEPPMVNVYRTLLPTPL